MPTLWRLRNFVIKANNDSQLRTKIRSVGGRDGGVIGGEVDT